VSSFTGRRSAQPCALTTSVSQISENWASGCRLVTRTGTFAGILELRRKVRLGEADIFLLGSRDFGSKKACAPLP
jgi:hypothetical protein